MLEEMLGRSNRFKTHLLSFILETLFFIRDSAKAVKTGMRPRKLYLHQEHARNECRFIESRS